MFTLLETLPTFIAYFAMSVILTGAFLMIYVRITPYDEFALIKQGLLAPAISLSGSLLGFVIALSSVITNSISLTDMALWGLIALLVQLLAFGLTRVIFKDLVQGITQNNIAKGLFLGILSLGFGLLNAACMTY